MLTNEFCETLLYNVDCIDKILNSLLKSITKISKNVCSVALRLDLTNVVVFGTASKTADADTFVPSFIDTARARGVHPVFDANRSRQLIFNDFCVLAV